VKSLGKKANPGEKKGVLLENKKKKVEGERYCPIFVILF
tara:strand:- start:743 stop:859 length:117 start_codon:yes stop_codon:yes gene_type:complete